MSIRRHNAKRDANEGAIVDAFERMGCEVCRIDVPCDLLVRVRSNIVLLVEVKTPKGVLTPDQHRFSQTWPVHVVRSVEDAFRLVCDARAFP